MQNYMANVAQAFAAGRQQRQDMETQRAMGALLGNPNDPQALQRLGQFNPQMAMQYQAQQQEAAIKQIEANRDKILMGAQIFRAAKAKNPNVPDEQLYASILPSLQQMGINTQGLPQPGDPQLPQYLQSIMAIADGLAPAKESQDPSFIREADILGIPREEAARLWKQRQGTVMINGIPHMASPNIAQAGPQPGQVEDGYRFKGGNPADPNAWEPVGGAGGNASGNFPR